MPTIRPTKRLLLPVEERARTVVENIISDQAQLRGMSHSDTILQDILDSQMPVSEFARFHVERVYARDCSLMGSLSAVLLQNVTGSIGTVARPNYKPLVEFGLSLIHHKCLGTALSNLYPINHHLKSSFESTVEALERSIEGVDDSSEKLQLAQKTKYGRELVRELNPELAAYAPAYSIVLFAIENFDIIGNRNSTCAYLCDAFDILSNVEKDEAETRVIPPDTPEKRAEWAKLLGEVTENWGKP